MRRIGLFILVLLAACSSDEVTRPTPTVLDGSWHHVRAADEPPGFFRQFTLTLSGTTLSGSGTWTGEAGPQGTVAVTGTVSGSDIHLDLVFTVTVPTPGLAYVQHFDGRLSSPTDMIGTVTTNGLSPVSEHYMKE
jgi:hypothetical protein